jgi:hypothetical protein
MNLAKNSTLSSLLRPLSVRRPPVIYPIHPVCPRNTLRPRETRAPRKKISDMISCGTRGGDDDHTPLPPPPRARETNINHHTTNTENPP